MTKKSSRYPHAIAHHKRGIAAQFAQYRATGLGWLVAFTPCVRLVVASKI